MCVVAMCSNFCNPPPKTQPRRAGVQHRVGVRANTASALVSGDSLKSLSAQLRSQAADVPAGLPEAFGDQGQTVRTSPSRAAFPRGCPASPTLWDGQPTVLAQGTRLEPKPPNSGAPSSLRFTVYAHTAASLAISAGTNVKVVHWMLGHSSAGRWTRTPTCSMTISPELPTS